MFWLRIGENGGLCESGNEPLDFIKFSEVLEWLHNWPSLEYSYE
jgi:hypothetical protein